MTVEKAAEPQENPDSDLEPLALEFLENKLQFLDSVSLACGKADEKIKLLVKVIDQWRTENPALFVPDADPNNFWVNMGKSVVKLEAGLVPLRAYLDPTWSSVNAVIAELSIRLNRARADHSFVVRDQATYDLFTDRISTKSNVDLLRTLNQYEIALSNDYRSFASELTRHDQQVKTAVGALGVTAKATYDAAAASDSSS